MLAARLVELGVATLHEAAGRRHLVRGVRLLVGEPFAGPAVTVGVPAGDNLGGLTDCAKIERIPLMEGKMMTALLAPKAGTTGGGK